MRGGRTQFVIDSGCTSHMVMDKTLFVEFNPVVGHGCSNANQTVSVVEGTGTIRIAVRDSAGCAKVVLLSNCLYLPTYARNLLSVSALENKGVSVQFSEPYCILCPDGVKFPFYRQGDLYVLEGLPCGESLSSVKSKGNSELWHGRMGHNNYQDLCALQRSVTGMGGVAAEGKHCDDCAVAKAHRAPVSRVQVPRSSRALDLVYSDVAGPIDPKSFGGCRFAISFIDSYSRYGRVYFMQTKGEALSRFQQFCADEGVPRALRTDNGGEYVSKGFQEFCRLKGIKREFTAPYSPHQNGVAERRWRTAMEMTRCLLRSSGLPKELWVRALDVAFYITNRCLTSSLPKGKTPYEMFFGQKPDLAHMRVFGCTVYKLKETHQPKLAEKASKVLFVGYGPTRDSYLLFDELTQRVSVSRNVSFNEMEFAGRFPVVAESDVPVELPLDQESGAANLECAPPVELEVEEDIGPDVAEEEVTTRCGRVVKKPAWLGLYECNFGQDVDSFEDIPETYDQVMRSTEKAEWLQAMQREFDALVENGTWELSELPAGKKTLGGRWVFCIKRDESGNILKYKARFVAKGYGQVYGSDYCETFAPTAKLTTIRASLALAAHRGDTVHQIDVKSAYLNAKISEEIYLEQPQGFERTGPDGRQMYCRLRKSLYGLKQAGREWNRMLDSWLVDQGFVRSKADHCLYVKTEGERRAFIVIWVDDILYFGDSLLVTSFKDDFSRDFKIDDRGQMRWFLGLEVVQVPGRIELTQKSYVAEILRRFDMVNCHPSKIPAEAGTKLSKSECPDVDSDEYRDLEETRTHYRSLVGKLLYLSVVSRPDLCFTVSNLSQFLSNPGRAHWVGAKRVMRYLKGYPDFRLIYRRQESAGILHCKVTLIPTGDLIWTTGGRLAVIALGLVALLLAGVAKSRPPSLYRPLKRNT